MSATRNPLVDVVEAVAEVEGVEPQELEYTLYEHVCPEAIQGLVEGDYEDWELTFRIPGHEVCLRADDGVYVDGEYVRALDGGRSGRVR